MDIDLSLVAVSAHFSDEPEATLDAWTLAELERDSEFEAIAAVRDRAGELYV